MIDFKRTLFILAVGLLLMPTAQAQSLETDLTTYLETQLQQQEVQGFSVAVVTAEDILYKRSFGVKNMYTQEPVTPSSLFHMASVTKTFVATALMQLHEAGKLDIDAPVVDVVPYFVLVDNRYKTLTIRQFASHISGMPDFDSDPWHHKEYDEDALERFVRDFIAHKFLTYPPETKYQYCNTGYELLGDVIAKASGMSFEDYVARHILEPLGMNQSTLLIREADFTQLNSLHYKKDDQMAVHDIYPYNRAHGPSSTLISSVDDMIKYLQMYLNQGKAGDRQILQPATIEMMFAPALGQFENVGFGWHRRQQGALQTYYHGGNDGFKSYVLLIPDRNVALVWQANTAEAPYHTFSQGLADIVLKYTHP